MTSGETNALAFVSPYIPAKVHPGSRRREKKKLVGGYELYKITDFLILKLGAIGGNLSENPQKWLKISKKTVKYRLFLVTPTGLEPMIPP